jgi:hypothetical protein
MTVKIEEILAGVETAPNAPVVLSPYGFKKVERGGKTYLQALTLEERLALEPTDSLMHRDPLIYDDGCGGTQSTGCNNHEPANTCRGQCNPRWYGDQMGWWCTCT